MDFHSLSRKELQTLCKKNTIPANITNVAMADALAALPQVEGLDELFNPMEPDAQQFQEEKVIGTPDIHRTACRTSTRRKAIREESESSKISTRLHRGARAGNAEGTEQENKDVNVPATPAMPSSRKLGPAISTRRKKEAKMPEDENNGGQGKPTDVPKTPAAPSTRTRATGRSVCSKIDTLDGTTAQRAYNTRRSVRLLEKNLSKMSLMDTDDLGLVKIGDISEDMSNVSQQTKDSAETEKFYDVGPSLQMVSTVVSDKTDELEVTSREKNSEYELGSGAENDVGANLMAEPQEGSETVLLFELEDSCDSSEPENKKCTGTQQDASIEVSEDASMEVADQDVAALSVEVPDDASMEVTDQDVIALSVEVPDDASVEVTGQDIAGSPPMSSVSLKENDSAEISALSVEVSEDASREATDQDTAGSLPMSSVSNDSVSLKELVACNTDNQDGTTEISDALMSELICNTNTLVDGDVIPEEIIIPKQESRISAETMKHTKSLSIEVPTVVPIYEQKSSDIPIQSIVADQLKGESHCPAQSEPNDVSNERIQEDDRNKIYMKENPGAYELQNRSMRELKKMLKNLTLGGKSNSKSNNVAKEVDRKRTALQALPENRMTAGEIQNDG